MPVASRSLIKTLNSTCVNALQGAAGLCLSRTNHKVEVEHWLFKLVEVPESDLTLIFRHFGVDAAVLGRDLALVIDTFRTGNDRTPSLSHHIDQWVRDAWLLASLQYEARKVRSGHLLLALLENDDLGKLARTASPELEKIGLEVLRANLTVLASGSVEDEPAAAAGEQAAPSAKTAAPGKTQPGVTQTPALDQYTIDLTDQARQGKLDPVIGREPEVRQMVDILIRRRQNNPILTGEAGVGKTAVVEGLAARVAAGDVPPALRAVSIRTLDLGLLQAGAGVKGEFENRLKQVIAEVKGSPTPIILFIDEAHTMIGAGGAAGQGDAANLLKPALARGELRTIAATTWSEYKKYFEKDAALTRRFQVVKVEEPDEPLAIRMMRGVASVLERHHAVRVLDEAVAASVKLSHRYIPARQLPDKSMSLLDTACARVAIGQSAVPPAVEDGRRLIEHLEREIATLERETATGVPHARRLDERQAELAQARATLAELEARWDEEKGHVMALRDLALEVEALFQAERSRHDEAQEAGSFTPSGALLAKQAELERGNAALRSMQGERPLMQVCVDAQTVAEVVAGWTGIPVGKMQTDEVQTVLQLRARLEGRVIGQTHALDAISQRIRTARANLTDARRPIGVFLLAGPSGVGKTETALALADALYGGERNLITINMSEFQEAHTVSTLKGSPPGYVGYGEGGVLTEAVRRRPHSVVLLDEVEKAHPDVLKLFYQVFDKGSLEDAEGREIDFKNTIILLTSNVGTETIIARCHDQASRPGPEELAEQVRPDLLAARTGQGTPIFKPAFLGRLIIVPYYPIADDVMRQIVRLQLDRIGARLRENHNAAFGYGEAVIDQIASRCRDVDTGARNVDHILTRTLLPELSEEFLVRMAEGKTINRVEVGVDESGRFLYDLE